MLINPYVFASGDFYRASRSLIIHANGANSSKTIIDTSPTPKTITANGDAQISTAQSKFGGSSLYMDGSGDFLSLDPSATELQLGTGDCTIQGWIYMIAFSTQFNETYWPILIRGAPFNTSFTNTQSYCFRYSPQEGNRLIFVHRTSAASFIEGSSVYTKRSTVLNLSLNTWYHVAVVRSGSQVKLYLNQSDVTDTSFGNYSWDTFNFSLNSSNNRFEIGRMRGGNSDPYNGSVFWDSNGYIDELIINKGIALAPSQFSYLAPVADS